ncbi:MAG: hypothetical protein L7T19_10905 [Pseudomonadales bacterium]|jgi:hypothetical protein|nr:hypothetical protein [Pseudomonadales bacterium]
MRNITRTIYRRLGALSLIAFSAIATAEIPRLDNGQPDLNGIWQVMSRANFDLLAHPARAAMAMQPGPFGPVPAEPVIALGAVGAVPAGVSVVEGNEIPYLPGKEVQQKENHAAWLNRDPEIKCYMPGVPRATYLPFPFQIFHSDQAIFIAYEFAGATRNLFLEDPGEAPVDSWMGQSHAWWEEDTLVVKVTGQNDRTWFDRTGHYHTEALVVTERYTLVNEHVIEYSATIEDPNVYSRPWTINMPIYKRVGADAQLLQFKCVEFVEELLYGELRNEPINPNRKSPLPED